MAEVISRLMLTVGQKVKIYRPPNYGRENATITSVNNTTGVIDVRTVVGNTVVKGVKWRQNSVDGDNAAYWCELPPGWVSG